MPAEKAGRQSLRRAQRNRSTRSTTRTVVGKALRTVDAGDPEEAQAAVKEAMSVLDRAVQKGVLHKNSASRRKSRMAARLNKLTQASA